MSGILAGGHADVKRGTRDSRAFACGCAQKRTSRTLSNGCQPSLLATWFPVGGYGSASQLVLPALTVALPWAAWYGIILRSNMLDVLSVDFARTAAAKGLGPWRIAVRHLLPNALLSVITMLGMDLAALLTGLALVEYIFGWPGIGWQALQAAQRFDVPMIMGSVLFGAPLIGTANLVVDLVYTWLDPRVRLG